MASTQGSALQQGSYHYWDNVCTTAHNFCSSSQRMWLAPKHKSLVGPIASACPYPSAQILQRAYASSNDLVRTALSRNSSMADGDGILDCLKAGQCVPTCRRPGRDAESKSSLALCSPSLRQPCVAYQVISPLTQRI
eukprot:5299897-Pleurochrysis_carterae.AAC.2